MSTKNIKITTDCVCDLPKEFLKAADIDLIHFYISTSKGRFRDGSEISAVNVIEYLLNGGTKAISEAPTVEDYISFFSENIEKCDELIHITITSVLSCSYENAVKATELMGDKGKNIYVIDSKSLSTSIGILVLKAIEMRKAGSTCQEICDAVNEMSPNISTTFITVNTEYLYQNGVVSKTVNRICALLKAHPVLTLKDGQVSVKNIRFGNYEKAFLRYIKSELKNKDEINKKRAFITHVGCSLKELTTIKECVANYCDFEEVIITNASATISCNCGPRAFGIIFTKYYESKGKEIV